MPKKSYPEDAIPRSPVPKHGGGDGLVLDAKLNNQRNQAPEDRQASDYDNIAKGWVRGAPEGKAPNMNNETGMDYPDGNFDKSPPRSKMRR